MVHLITGYAGYEHIKSADSGSFNAAFFGGGQFVMEMGNQFSATIVDNSTVRIADGDGLMYGRHFRIEPNTHEDVTISTGTAGKNRIDIICATYSKNASDGTETTVLQVIKGAESTGTAVAPAYTTGNILEGAVLNQMPLYKVNISGVVLSSVEPLFTTIPTYKTLAELYAAQFAAEVEEYSSTVTAAQKTASNAATAAANAQKTASNAATAAANAQTTATNAGTAAANAQSTANTAKSNAAAAQSTADTAKTAANEAKAAASTAQSTANAATAYTSGLATLDTANTSGGAVRFQKYGRVVVVELVDPYLKVSTINSKQWTSFRIATGLPAPTFETTRCHMNIECSAFGAGVFYVDTNGELKFYHYNENLIGGQKENAAYASGIITYISAS
jgi:hypothetical protein